MRTSFAPVYSSTYNTFFQLRPPSVLLNSPRSVFGPHMWPAAATKTMSGLEGSIATRPICRVSFNPMFVHVLPAFVDL